jgi:hypothetical protein
MPFSVATFKEKSYYRQYNLVQTQHLVRTTETKLNTNNRTKQAHGLKHGLYLA